MRTAEQVLELYKDRMARYAGVHQGIQLIGSVYNGEVKVPLPDMEREEEPAVPNLLQQGVDQMAGRITSVVPSVTFASVKPGVRKHDRNAISAASAVTGWWQLDRLSMKQKQRGRRLIAYAMSPTVMRWNFTEHRPFWQVRHPLETYPSPDLEPGKISPEDCIFAYRKTAGWMVANGYAEHLYRLVGEREVQRDAIVTIVEYIDAEVTMLLATGYYPSTQYDTAWGDGNALRGIVMREYRNPIDMIPVTIPTRLTLDKMTGQFDNMLAMYFQQARLMALENIAVEKGIFPDTYLVSRPGEIGRFIDGPHDGRTGLVNIIQGGDIQTEQPQPGYLTNPTIDRLERNQRVTSGIPAEFGGESSTNIRTGRRGDAVLSATIDFPVAEAQETFAYALEQENRIAIKMAKRFDGMTPRTIYVGVGNSTRPVTYKANETFENEEHVVSYPAAGSDVNSLVIGIGQRVGLGIMSKKTAATLDPYIDNPETEHDQIIAEGLEQALVSGLQQQAAQGAIPPLVLSKVMTLVRNDKMELAEAITKVTEEAMREQQAEQQAQAMPGMPGEGMSPDAAMAPAALAAMAGPQAQAAISGPNPSQYNLGQLLTTLRRGSRSVA